MAIALVQSRLGTNVSSLAFSSSVTAGSLIVVAAVGYDSPFTSSSDSRNGSHTNAIAGTTWSSNGRLGIMYFPNAAAGSTTVSITSYGGDVSYVIAEFSGVATTSPVDITPGSVATGSSSTAAAAATGTLTQADELIIAIMGHLSGTVSLTQDTADGFSLLQEHESASQMPMSTQYKITSATTSITPNWALGGSVSWGAARVTFKAAAGGDGSTGTAAWTEDADTMAAAGNTTSPPGTPTGLTATAPGDSGEVDLTWTAPDSGGSAITDYVIQYRMAQTTEFTDSFTSNVNPLPAPWTARNGSNFMQKTGGAATYVTSTVDSTYVYGDVSRVDSWVQATVRCDDGFAGVQLGIGGTFRNEAIDAVINPTGNFALNKHTNSVETELDSAGGAGDVAYVIRAEREGSTCRMYVDGVLVNTGTNTDNASNKGVGIGSYRVSGVLTIDDFSAGSLASAWSTFSDGTSTSTSATVTGLTNGVLYEFRVAGVNALGTGPYSATDDATPFSAVTGTAAWTEDADTMAAAGRSTHVGTSAWTEAADTMAASGAVSTTGTAAWTEDADTLAAAGYVGAKTGTVAWTEDADTLASAGYVTTIGTAAWTEDADTLAASGSSGLAKTGTAAWTEDSDTAAAAGKLTRLGTAAWTEDADAFAADGSSGSAKIGTAAWTEADDTAAAAGKLTRLGTAAWTEDSDTFAATGRSTHAGTAAWTEDADTLAGTGGIYGGQAAWTDADDTFLASARITRVGTAAWTEADDVLVAHEVLYGLVITGPLTVTRITPQRTVARVTPQRTVARIYEEP